VNVGFNSVINLSAGLRSDINKVKNPILFMFLPFLSSFFEFGRQHYKFFTESSLNPFSLRQRSVVKSGFQVNRIYGLYESLKETFISDIVLILNLIPQQYVRVRIEIGRYRKG
jgi:hypothetical protein